MVQQEHILFNILILMILVDFVMCICQYQLTNFQGFETIIRTNITTVINVTCHRLLKPARIRHYCSDKRVDYEQVQTACGTR